LTVAIAGAGVGGLTAAIALRQFGHEVTVFEQASQFGRVGADVNLTPNAVRALTGLGLREAIERTAARTTHRNSRAWDTGELLSSLVMSDEAERRYGAPQLTVHRADLLQALEDSVPVECVCLGRKVVGVDQSESTTDGRPGLVFADGSIHRADVVVGADGIHSTVRTWMLGPESPRFTGVVSFRAVVPAERLRGHPALGTFTKWWGPTPDSELVTFPLARGEEVFVFATAGQEGWTEESWTLPGSVTEFRELYTGYHADARALIDACDSVLKTAMYERDPLPTWVAGGVALLGDACHPMLPFMAQGACTAIEDAVILARCVSESGVEPAAALRRYEHLRKERTARIQLASRGNAWLKDRAEDADWVYGYDVWAVPCADVREQPQPVREPQPVRAQPQPAASRLAALQPAQLDDSQRAIYDAVAGGDRARGVQHFPLVAADGSLNGPFGVLLHAPSVGMALQQLGADIRYRTGLTPRIREVAILQVAHAVDSRFEWWAHERVGRAAGLTAGDITQLSQGTFASEDPAESAAAAFCRSLLATSAPTDAEYESAAAVLSTAQLIELTALVGYYRTLAQLMEVFAIGTPDDSHDGAD
jgi:salicylate hydroxylase